MNAAEREAVRLATLREIRREAYALDNAPENDPYTWGYGGREICRMISNKIREIRNLQEED